MLRDAFIDFCRRPDCLFGVDYKGGDSPRLLSARNEYIGQNTAESWTLDHGAFAPLGTPVITDGKLIKGGYRFNFFPSGMRENWTLVWRGRVVPDMIGGISLLSGGGCLNYYGGLGSTYFAIWCVFGTDSANRYSRAHTLSEPETAYVAVMDFAAHTLTLHFRSERGVWGEARNTNANGVTAWVEGNSYLQTNLVEGQAYAERMAFFRGALPAGEFRAICEC